MVWMYSVPSYELEDPCKHSSADMKQSGKHEVLMELSKLCSKVPITLSTLQLMFQMAVTLLCQFEEHRSKVSPKMTQSAKHRIFLRTFRWIFFFQKSQNWFNTVAYGQNIHLSISWRIVGNVIKLLWNNLENTEFLTEFHRICSKVPLTLSTLQLMFEKRTRNALRKIPCFREYMSF